MVKDNEVEIVPPEDIALLLAMRDAAMKGRTVHIRKNRQTGRLIAHVEVMHDAADYKNG